MNEKPPERGRRSVPRHRRLEGRIVVALVGGILTAGVMMTRPPDNGLEGASIPTVAGGMSLWVPVAAIFAIMFLNALYVSAEASLQLLKSVHLKIAAEHTPKTVPVLEHLLSDRAKHLAACSLAIQILRLGLFLVCLWVAPGIVSSLPESMGWNGYVETVAVAVLLLVPVALANMIIEMVPRTYAGLAPQKVAPAVYQPILLASLVLSPFAKLVAGLATVFTARFGVRASLAVANITEEEIKTLVDTAQETGDIESDEKEMLHSVFEFADTVAREVMTPRVDLDAVPLDIDPGELIALIKLSGHSRIPVYEDTDDQIVGIVHAKDLLMAVAIGETANLRKLMRPALFVPENKDLHQLLAEMRSNRTQMAVVQDEFGGTAGIVTIEDIVEELVGEIVDEYDQEEPEIVEEGEGWSVDGRTHLDDFNHVIDAEFDSEEFDTVGGYVFGLFGRQPKEGESIVSEGYSITVSGTDGRRILRLHVEKVAKGNDESDEASESA